MGLDSPRRSWTDDSELLLLILFRSFGQSGKDLPVPRRPATFRFRCDGPPPRAPCRWCKRRLEVEECAEGAAQVGEVRGSRLTTADRVEEREPHQEPHQPLRLYRED